MDWWDQGLGRFAAVMAIVLTSAALAGGGCKHEAPPPEPQPECVADPDCGEGRVCEGGRCMRRPEPKPECASNTDCPDGQECDEGTCVTRGSSPINAGE